MAMNATVSIIVTMNDEVRGATNVPAYQSAATTLTLSESDLKAILFKWREFPDAAPSPADQPASADITVAYLGAMVDNDIDFAVQNYRDAGGTI